MNACSCRETGVLPAFTLRCRTGLRRLLDKMVLLNAAAFYFEIFFRLKSAFSVPLSAFLKTGWNLKSALEKHGI